ncbi:MAG: outer membrane protein assembly factor BamC [Xanthomonadales bacterium]|nr:outer membrane protein assembly factor BamC [Xanthomonadales bacterium]
MKKVLLLVLCVLLLLALTACGRSEKRQTAYIRAVEVSPLEVPTDLDPPRTDTAVTPAIAAADLPSVNTEPKSTLPPLVLSSGQLENSNVTIAYSAQGTYLLLEDTLASTWRRVGLSLPRMGLSNIATNEADLTYDFDYVHQRLEYDKTVWETMKFWQDHGGPDYSGRYRLQLKEVGKGRRMHTRIYLQDAIGQPVDAAAAGVVFGSFLERLG